MTKNEVRFNNEMNLVKDGTGDSISKVMKMMYHDLGYHRKNSLLHTYDLVHLIASYNKTSDTDYILGVAFIDNLYTKSSLINTIQSRLSECKHELATEKAEYKASQYLATTIHTAINHIQSKTTVDIKDSLDLTAERFDKTLKRLGSNYSIQYDINRVNVLEHELLVLKHNDFNNTLYTFIPRNSLSVDDPTLRKPISNPKSEYSKLIHFDGLSKSKSKKIVQLKQFKAKWDVDFRPATIDDLKHSFTEWLGFVSL